MGCCFSKFRFPKSSKVSQEKNGPAENNNQYLQHLKNDKPKVIIIIGGPLSSKGELILNLKKLFGFQSISLAGFDCPLTINQLKKTQKDTRKKSVEESEDEWLKMEFEKVTNKIAATDDCSCFLIDILKLSRFVTEKIALADNIDEILHDFSCQVNILFVININTEQILKELNNDKRTLLDVTGMLQKRISIYENCSTRFMKYFETRNFIFTLDGYEELFLEKATDILNKFGFRIKKTLSKNFIFSIDENDFANVLLINPQFKMYKICSSDISHLTKLPLNENSISSLHGVLLDHRIIDELLKHVKDVMIDNYIFYDEQMEDCKLCSIQNIMEMITTRLSCSNFKKLNSHFKYRTFKTINDNYFIFHYSIPQQLNRYFIQKLD